MAGINQRNYDIEARQLMKELFDIGYKLKGTNVNIEPLTKIMEHTYGNYILPKEVQDAKEKGDFDQEKRDELDCC